MNWVAPVKDEETLRRYKETLMAMNPKYYILFEIGSGTGMQLQEILRLKVKDVRGKDELECHIGTRNIRRVLRFTPQFCEIVDHYTKDMNEEEWLLPGGQPGGQRLPTPLSREQAYRALKEAGRKIGLSSIGAQTMRKTFAWHYYKETGDIYYLTNLLNHASPSITYRYIGEKPNVGTVLQKMTPEENERARATLYKDGEGRRRMENVKDTMNFLEEELNNPANTDSYYGRIDCLLSQIEELISDFFGQKTSSDE